MSLLYRPQVIAQPESRKLIRWGHPLAQSLIFSAYNAASDWLVAPVNYVTGRAGSVCTAVTSGNGPLGYATEPKGDGATTLSKAKLNLAPYRRVSFSWWAYWDANANDSKTIWGYGNLDFAVDSGLVVIPNESTTSQYLIALGETATQFGVFPYSRPSAATWHHYGLTIDRNTPSTWSIFFYVDGVVQSVTGGTSTLLGGTDFGANLDLQMLCGPGSGTQRFGAGRIACFNVWSRILNNNDFKQMMLNSNQILVGDPQIIGVPRNIGRWFLCQ